MQMQGFKNYDFFRYEYFFFFCLCITLLVIIYCLVHQFMRKDGIMRCKLCIQKCVYNLMFVNNNKMRSIVRTAQDL